MDLNKEKALKEAYEKLLEVGFGEASIEEMPQFIAEDVMGYGTALDEKIMSIEEFVELIRDQRKQSQQFDDFHYTSNPVIIRLSENGQSALVVDEIELITVIDGKSNPLPLRMSTVLEIKNGTWKITHWHGSLAEHVSDGEDPWHVNQWIQKTEKLERLVEEKTVDLANKNRVLEIETALERVRSIALSMSKSDDLMNVCKVIAEQLVSLKVNDIRNVQVAIIDESKKTYLNYQYFVPYSQKVFEETEYEQHPVVQEMVSELQKSANSFFTGSMKGKELKEFCEWRNKCNQYPDPKLEKSQTAFYYFYSIGAGGLGLTTYKKISDTSLEIFKRFHNVFKLAFQRFQDIEMAQEKAREAQIEGALERVRTRSMAMHHTNELQEVINTVHQEFSNLDMDITGGAFIAINADIDKEIICWGAGGTADYIQRVHIPFLDRPIYTGMVEGIKAGPGFSHEAYSQEEKIEFFEHLFKNPPHKSAPARRKREIMSRPGGYIRVSLVSEHTTIFIINHHGRKFSEVDINVLKRFGKVFEQTYTRFLDLKKAEEQAREAQVELSLERIRAQVTVMSESIELLDIVVTMRSEFVSLGHEAHYFWYMRWLPDSYEKAMTSGDGTRIGMVMSLPRHIHGDIKLVADWEESDEPTVIFPMDVETAVDYVNKMITLGDFIQVDPQAPTLDDIRHIGGLTFVMARTRYGEIGFSLPGAVPDPPQDSIDTLFRFAGVFDLAYSRFEDLQKAEAQTKETLIELSLERIRAQVTAMQESSDLFDIVVAMRKEFISLGHQADYFWHMQWLPENYEMSMTSEDGNRIGMIITVPKFVHEGIQSLAKWEKSNEPAFVLALDAEGAWDYIDKMNTYGQYEQVDPNAPSKDDIQHIGGLTFIIARTRNGEIGYSLPGEVPNPPQESIDILIRFAGVFDLAYSRFEDLKSAERQYRETQIELALERVRARTMAMHKSEELPQAAALLFQEFKSLGKIPDRLGIVTYDKEQKSFINWITDQSGFMVDQAFISSIDEPTTFQKIYRAWKENKDYLIIELTGKNLEKWLNFIKEKMKLPIDESHIQDRRIHYVAFHSNGFLMSTYHEPLEDNFIHLLVRFTKVFEQTYIRFLDLKLAEGQARESRIEASLERIRSRALAMQQSNEVGDVNDVLFEEFDNMGIDVIGCGISVIDEETDYCEQWRARQIAVVTSYEPYSLKKANEILSQNMPPNWLPDFMAAWKRGDSIYQTHMEGKQRDAYILSVASIFNYSNSQRDEILNSYPKSFNASYIFYKRGWLSLTTHNPLTEDEVNFSRRFVEAFDFAHTRFYDLKKAEDQAKEAQIEAALERIRAQAMAMQHSSDLFESAFIVFEEFEKLKLSVSRCGIGIIDPETADCELWSTVTRSNGNKEIATGRLSLLAHPMLKGTYDAWLKQQSHAYTLEGEELADYYKIIAKSGFKLPSDIIKKAASLPKQYYYNSLFGAGGLYVISNVEPSEKEKLIIHRFSEVFHLTYTRYQDLQKAESQAIEAVKQASLDRVRGEIASMRTSEDLQRITPLIWKELETLEVPFIRCGVFIVDESASLVNVYLSTPDGKPLGALHLPFDASDLTTSAVDHWRKKRIFTQHWNQDTFVEWMQSMVKMGQVSQREYQDGDTPPESLDLHFIPFDQGMLYVGNSKALKQEEIELVHLLANAFAIAYSRYEDFKNLEVAMSKVEQTLSELKSTQSQLVHSEKMASLGELTAGIAHEIQNPLNFVNNFAEVSVDLIGEMNEEITTGNTDDVIAISDDLKQNLEKIHHHGHRASSIVKGMLEHSRASDGHKEPTDINELADEYLRLAYHGLRAKDKSFQADFKTEFSKDLPKIKVVPQEIGRVLLNLINNAFYAVAKVAKNDLAGSKGPAAQKQVYKPLVIVSTRKLDQGVEIRVKDNGGGIPDDVKEKIFQPFFTTKPTGEGTGLGLSLSFDIITKGHGGELMMNSIEGKGTEFIITIP